VCRWNGKPYHKISRERNPKGGVGSSSNAGRGVISISRDLERYYALLPRVLPTFSEAEAYLIVDALNGSLCQSELIHVHWVTIEDAILLDHLDQKWNIDGKQFLARLHQFSPFELIAIRDAAERFWHIVSSKDHPPSDEVLRQVGLVSRSASATLEKAS
jgi:hypothetical protein